MWDSRILQTKQADPDGDALTVTLSAPSESMSSGGDLVVWSGDGTQTLIGTAGGQEVIRIAISNSGEYTVTLSRPIDHLDETVEDDF